MFSETSGDVGIVHRRTMVFVPARFRYFAVFPRFSLSFFMARIVGDHCDITAIVVLLLSLLLLSLLSFYYNNYFHVVDFLFSLAR